MLQLGDVVNGTYRVEGLLGGGGMADVYAVAHMRIPRKFALKVMHLETRTSWAFLSRFDRECEILASLKHPHIVDIIDRNQLPDGNPYLVMEMLEGEDLAKRLEQKGALSIPAALRICRQIGAALDAAHQVQVVHRDLKPSNDPALAGSAYRFLEPPKSCGESAGCSPGIVARRVSSRLGRLDDHTAQPWHVLRRPLAVCERIAEVNPRLALWARRRQWVGQDHAA